MIPPNAIDKSKTAAILLPGNGERINVIGDAQTIKLDGEMTTGLFAMIEGLILSRVHMERHVGALNVVGEIEILLSTGTTVYLPRGVPHGFRVNKSTRALLCVYPSGAENMFRILSELPQGSPDMEKVTNICAEYGIYFV